MQTPMTETAQGEQEDCTGFKVSLPALVARRDLTAAPSKLHPAGSMAGMIVTLMVNGESGRLHELAAKFALPLLTLPEVAAYERMPLHKTGKIEPGLLLG